jgi:hypothetical protein
LSSHLFGRLLAGRGAVGGPTSMMMRVACCGEHTTHSGHPEFLPEYPGRVAALLGSDVDVQNFGFPMATACRKNAPAGGKTTFFVDTAEAAQCVVFRPNVIVLGPFGKQDTLGPFRSDDVYGDQPWQLFSQDEYAGGLKELCEWALGTGATVLLALPIPFPFGSAAHSCASVIVSATQAVAKELSLSTIDLYSSFENQADKFTDADHLTDAAIDLLASSVAAAVSAACPKL